MGPENYLGSISMFGGDYAPRDYAFLLIVLVLYRHHKVRTGFYFQ